MDNFVPWGDIERISYVLVDSTNRAPGMDLYRAVTRNLLSQTQEPPFQQRLMGGVQSLVFYFYDGNQWLDSWDSAAQTNLPLAIKVQIQLAAEGNASVSTLSAPIELVVLVDAQAGTNQTQLASGGQQ
jgi:hypothetical protein